MLAICKEIVVFLIVAKMLESFQNGGKYGKFVKLIISLIVVLKIITPIFSLLGGDFYLEKMASEIEQRFVIESEKIEVSQEVKPIENIEITGTTVNVEDIQWEK